MLAFVAAGMALADDAIVCIDGGGHQAIEFPPSCMVGGVRPPVHSSPAFRHIRTVVLLI